MFLKFIKETTFFFSFPDTGFGKPFATGAVQKITWLKSNIKTLKFNLVQRHDRRLYPSKLKFTISSVFILLITQLSLYTAGEEVQYLQQLTQNITDNRLSCSLQPLLKITYFLKFGQILEL